jgi:hypothetical protein
MKNLLMGLMHCFILWILTFYLVLSVVIGILSSVSIRQSGLLMDPKMDPVLRMAVNTKLDKVKNKLSLI